MFCSRAWTLLQRSVAGRFYSYTAWAASHLTGCFGPEEAAPYLHPPSASCCVLPLQTLYLRYVETASKVESLTTQLADSQAQRAAAEQAAQEAKLERSRALRAAEEAAFATAAAADDTDALKQELEEERRAAAAREAVVAGLEADLKGRDEEIARLQAFVHRAELLQMECDGLKLKVWGWTGRVRGPLRWWSQKRSPQERHLTVQSLNFIFKTSITGALPPSISEFCPSSRAPQAVWRVT